ncbi:CFI-box-CTERM domain-containing protein [Verminephrobacter aporrectodeae]|uniref:CFI-box-CTERM domain-containing protein n=1 Tax=Verminephrobacter aporrectodeae TaxID=1110389 RepID=UPI001F302552|nr:CFI-box-CTERM domain-containing protein [Verminephrobacter aporrectodeae]
MTDIVATVYCEQKAVFDAKRGEAQPPQVHAKAAAGTFEHLRFQAEGHTRVAIDRRCFIATAIYGSDAPETDFLRDWRDRVLTPNRHGRALVRAYYAISPRLLPILSCSQFVAGTVRVVLDRLLRWLGMHQ